MPLVIRRDAAVNRALAAKLNHEGLSEEEIGKRLGRTPKTIRVFLHDFLKTDIRWPVDLAAPDVNLMRVQHREKLNWAAGVLSRRIAELESDPTLEAAESTGKLVEELGRTLDRVADLDGLNAPEAKAVNSVTHNSVTLNKTTEITVLRDLLRYRESEQANARLRLPSV